MSRKKGEHPVDRYVRLAYEAYQAKGSKQRRVLRRAAARAKLEAQLWMARNPGEAGRRGLTPPGDGSQ